MAWRCRAICAETIRVSLSTPRGGETCEAPTSRATAGRSGSRSRTRSSGWRTSSDVRVDLPTGSSPVGRPTNLDAHAGRPVHRQGIGGMDTLMSRSGRSLARSSNLVDLSKFAFALCTSSAAGKPATIEGAGVARDPPPEAAPAPSPSQGAGSCTTHATQPPSRHWHSNESWWLFAFIRAMYAL